jgi:hypothetical protein
MERLIAHFTITLAEPILVEDREGAKHTCKVAYDSYEAGVTWSDEDVSLRMWGPGSSIPRYPISRLTITVSHPETEPYPEGHDERVLYIQTRLEAYATVAAAVTNRVILYFKFFLGNPLLQAITPQQLINSNPAWMDENNTPLPRAIVYFEMKAVAGLRYYPAFGIKVFTPAQSDDLQKALQMDTSYELYEELLVDARDALIQGNLRRAVIEMATACEVATKELFAKKGKRGSEKIPVALNTHAKKAFGISFKEKHPKDWDHIEYLFQCRNDAAHGTAPKYTVKGQNPQTMDFDNLRDWWASLEILIAWVRSQ